MLRHEDEAETTGDRRAMALALAAAVRRTSPTTTAITIARATFTSTARFTRSFDILRIVRERVRATSLRSISSGSATDGSIGSRSSIPTAAASTVDVDAGAGKVMRHGGRRLMKVLVVEDEPRIAADISAALKASGMAVDVATDGEDAWFRGDTETYDAAILDLGLPKLDGLTVLKRWRANGRRFPVLILTARGVWTERVEGINAGADDYLPKPFEMEELLARLRALLRRSAGQAAPVLNSGPLLSGHAPDADIAPRRAGRAVAARVSAAGVSHASRRARRGADRTCRASVRFRQ